MLSDTYKIGSFSNGFCSFNFMSPLFLLHRVFRHSKECLKIIPWLKVLSDQSEMKSFKHIACLLFSVAVIHYLRQPTHGENTCFGSQFWRLHFLTSWLSSFRAETSQDTMARASDRQCQFISDARKQVRNNNNNNNKHTTSPLGTL